MTDFPTKHESNRANDISGVAFTMYNYTLIKIVESKSWAQYDPWGHIDVCRFIRFFAILDSLCDFNTSYIVGQIVSYLVEELFMLDN
jgi:hypothetical protein